MTRRGASCSAACPGAFRQSDRDMRKRSPALAEETEDTPAGFREDARCGAAQLRGAPSQEVHRSRSFMW